MAGADKRETDERPRTVAKDLRPGRPGTAAPPDLLATEAAPDPAGNFKDLESLLEQLGEAPVYELGKPLPEEKFLLKMRVGSCPAAHNRALLDEESD
ncbi:MAG: hypothetical protein ACTHOI_03025 [Sphingomicrobium sp.]